MSDFEFDIPQRYNKTFAEEGIDVDITTEGGDKVGTFKICFIDQTLPAGEQAYERVQKKYQRQLKTGELTGWDRIKVMVCELFLVDWSGITAKGKPVPFSVENALKYFSHEQTRWIAWKLYELANDPANFVGVGEAEEAEKNS